MAAIVITPTEDVVFDTLWEWVKNLFDTADADAVFKGFQNVTSTPYDSYVVLSPGVKVRQDQIRREYVAATFSQLATRNTTYSYQVDCYGPKGPDWADVIAIAWRTMWACDSLRDQAITPLYADEPQQLNIVNAEAQYEQRYTARLFMQVNQTVDLPQDFFQLPFPIDVEPPTNYLPVDLLPP